MTRRNLPYPLEVKNHPLPMKAWEAANWKNSNFIIFINGLPGSGKSVLAAYLQYILDRGKDYGFRCELKNWCLTQKTFVTAINTNNQVGKVVVWEEPYAAGVKDGGANARDFAKYANKQISTIFQTMRKNNNIIILTLPATGSFDKQARNMAHCLIHVKSNNGIYGIARVYLDYNPIFDTVLHPFIRTRRRGRMVRVKNLFFGLPPRRWLDLCTEKSDNYKDFWRNEIAKYKGKDGKVSSRANLRLSFLVAHRNNPGSYRVVRRGKETWDYTKISKDFGVSYSTAVQWSRTID